MHVQVVTCPFDPARGGIDPRPLESFCRDKAVLAVREHLYTHEALPYLTLVIEYEQPAGAAPDRRPARRLAEAPDPRALVPADKQPLFDRLRAWRAGAAREEGAPAFAVLTNRQLVEIATAAPATPDDLAAVPGLGRVKTERYGQAILELVRPAGDGGTPRKRATRR